MEGNSKADSSSSNPTAPASQKNEPAPDVQLAYIAVKGPEFQTKQSYPRSEILKVAMDEIIRTQKFELVFSSTQAFRDANYLFFELHLRGKEVKWGDGQKGYDLDYFLFNGKSGKLVTESHRERVFERHLQYTTRVMLYEVFYGKELAQKKAAEKEKEPNKESEREKEDGKDLANAQKKSREKPPEKDPSKKSDEELEKNNKKPNVPSIKPATPKKAPEIEIPVKKKNPKMPRERTDGDESSNEKQKSNGNSKPDTKPPGEPEKSNEIPPEEEPKVNENEKPKSDELLAESIRKELEAHVKFLKKKKKTLEDEIKEDEKKRDVKKDKEVAEAEESIFKLSPQTLANDRNPDRTSSKIDKTYTMGFDFLVNKL
ncbi:MAG: hypothetical protein AABY86_08455, partial [Bdellovibrionota bacterium]